MDFYEAQQAEEKLERVMDVALWLEPGLARAIRLDEVRCRYEIFLQTEQYSRYTVG
jgi:hypothetical protein